MTQEQNANGDGWIEAGNATGQVWSPENEGDSITGIYVRMKENVGTNNSKVYLIQVEGNDEPTSVWGSTVLDARFEEIPESSLVSIEYLGRVKGKGPKPYKNYRVLYKRPEEMPKDFLNEG